MEIWRPVTKYNMFGYDGNWRYEVSNLGNVRRAGYWGYKRRKYYQPRMMMQQKDRRGRMKVTLTAECSSHTFYVHRLVAMSFVEGPVFADKVIHKDGDVANNNADNLMWTPSTGNSPYVKGAAKAVRQYTKDGVFVAEYASASAAQRVTGFDHSTISACCHRKKRRMSYRGYIWRFVTDDEFSERG